MRTYVIIGRTYWHKTNGHTICSTTLFAQDRVYALGINGGSGDMSYQTGITKIAEIERLEGEYFEKMNALREMQKTGDVFIHHQTIPVAKQSAL